MRREHEVRGGSATSPAPFGYLADQRRAPIALQAFAYDDVRLTLDVLSDPLNRLTTTVPTTPGREEHESYIDPRMPGRVSREGIKVAITDAKTDQALGQADRP